MSDTTAFAPYPTKCGATGQPLVCVPGFYDTYWFGSGVCDFYTTYTEEAIQAEADAYYSSMGQLYRNRPRWPIGSRFD